MLSFIYHGTRTGDKENTMNHIELSSVLHFFEEISRIPRASGNEKGVAEYLVRFAEERGLFHSVDSAGNVLIKKPAQGSDSAPVILQGHMDMVAEKIDGSDHSFETDPIRLIYDGDILRADGTTLGADNGIGVSLILAVLDSDTLRCPPLECVFTVSEEIGLLGADKFDFAALSGRRYLNLDSEGEGAATVACAGGVRCDIDIPLPEDTVQISGNDIKITLSGLAGGHSGEDINKRRANALLMLSHLISAASAAVTEAGFTSALVSMNGGSKDNAIPHSATAVVRTDAPDIFTEALSDAANERMQFLCDEDMLCRISVTASAPSGKAIGNRLPDLISELPCGVIEMEPNMPDCVRTSANLGIVNADENRISVVLSARSSSDSELDMTLDSVEKICKGFGGTVSPRGRYTGWARRESSELRAYYADATRRILGKEAEFLSIHAGLECGIVSKKVPDMDMISIGPVIKNMHSPDETVSLSSVERFARLVSYMLENM